MIGIRGAEEPSVPDGCFTDNWNGIKHVSAGAVVGAVSADSPKREILAFRSGAA